MTKKPIKEKTPREVIKKEKIHFFSILWSIIWKNLKLIMRSKTSSVIVILGPLLIIAMVGTAYNTSNIYDIRIGAYSSEYSELSDSLLNALGSQQFSIVKFSSQEECIGELKAAQIHVCAIIPANLQTGSEEAIDFHVDQSRVNLVWIIIDAVSSKVSSKKQELSLQLTNSILNTLIDTQSKLTQNENLLSEVEGNSAAVKAKVTEVATSINVDVSDAVDLGKISQKLDEIVDANNLSSSLFDPVKTTISKVKNNTDALSQSFESVTEDLNEIEGDLESNSGSISDLASILRDLKKNIEAATGQSAEDIVTPLKTNVKPIVAEKTHLSFLFPTLVILVTMLMSLILSSGLVIREKTDSAFFRNYLSPVKDGTFILGHFLTNFIILLLQLVVILGVAAIFFKDALYSVLGNVIVLLILIVPVFILIGMAVGYIFKSEETSMLATLSIASIFLFFSSTILPLETLPASLKRIAEFNPFVLSESILKKVMLFKINLVDISEPILILVGYIILLIVVVYAAEKMSKLRIE